MLVRVPAKHVYVPLSADKSWRHHGGSSVICLEHSFYCLIFFCRDLSSNNLTGDLPSSIGLLSNLSSLYVASDWMICKRYGSLFLTSYLKFLISGLISDVAGIYKTIN